MKESLFTNLRSKIEYYESTYRHPGLERFAVGNPYALFPTGNEMGWDKEWPNSRRAGVYLIYGENRLLYVGTASKLGPRLANYFQYDFPGGKGNQCKIVHNGWTEVPKYVVTVAVPEGSRFEASALEEYLIGELAPCDNTLGRL